MLRRVDTLLWLPSAWALEKPVTKEQTKEMFDSIFKDNFGVNNVREDLLSRRMETLKGCSTRMAFDDCLYRECKGMLCPEGVWNIDLGIWDDVTILDISRFISWSWCFTFPLLACSKSIQMNKGLFIYRGFRLKKCLQQVFYFITTLLQCIVRMLVLDLTLLIEAARNKYKIKIIFLEIYLN